MRGSARMGAQGHAAWGEADGRWRVPARDDRDQEVGAQPATRSARPSQLAWRSRHSRREERGHGREHADHDPDVARTEASTTSPPDAHTNAKTRYPRPWWFRAGRWVLNLSWLAFVAYPGVVAGNLITLAGANGLEALSRPDALRKAFLIDRLFAELSSRPLLVVVGAAGVAVFVLIGRLAHADREREKKYIEALRSEYPSDSSARPSPEAPGVPPRDAPFDIKALPVPEHFVGRISELDDLLALLRAGETTQITPATSTPSTTSLSGLAGIGKTTLAGMAVRRIFQEKLFTDGIVVYKGEERTNATFMLREILSRFDPFGREPQATTAEQLREAAHRLLDDKRALIVIDNVEPGLDVRQVVDPLHETGTTVLLTARQQLALGHRFVLGLLSPAEALELFALYYASCQPTDLQDEERAIAGRIVTALERHTLAVKLAAAYARTSEQSLEAVEKELTDPERVITIQSAVEGEQEIKTLEVVLASSFDNLQPTARKLFAALGAFSQGEFGFNAVLAVARGLGITGPEQYIDLLIKRALVDQSHLLGLPDAVDTARLVLHPLLRAYAERRHSDLLRPHERDAARRALASYYARYTSALPALGVGISRVATGADERNIVGSLDWATEQGKEYELVALLCMGMQPFWRDFGRAAATERYLPAGIAAATAYVAAEPTLRARLMLARLRLGYAQFLRLRKLDAAEATSQGILAVFEEAGDLRGQGSTLTLLGNIARDRAQFAVAEDYLQRALAIFRQPELDDRSSQGLMLSFLGQNSERLGELLLADERLRQAYDLYEGVGDRWGMGLSLQLLGNISLRAGRYGEAGDRFTRALALHQALRNRRGEAVDVSGLGQVAQGLGRFVEAERHYRESLAIRVETRDVRGEAVDHTLLGQFALDRERPDEAERSLHEALTIWRDLGDPRGMAWCLSVWCRLDLERGDPVAAAGRLREAVEVSRGKGDRPGEAARERLAGQLALVRDGGDTAGRSLQAAREIAREVGDRPEEQRILLRLGEVAMARDELGEAEECWRQSLALAQAMEAPLATAHSLEALGSMLVARETSRGTGCILLSEAADRYAALGLSGASRVREISRRYGC